MGCARLTGNTRRSKLRICFDMFGGESEILRSALASAAWQHTFFAASVFARKPTKRIKAWPDLRASIKAFWDSAAVSADFVSSMLLNIDGDRNGNRGYCQKWCHLLRPGNFHCSFTPFSCNSSSHLIWFFNQLVGKTPALWFILTANLLSPEKRSINFPLCTIFTKLNASRAAIVWPHNQRPGASWPGKSDHRNNNNGNEKSTKSCTHVTVANGTASKRWPKRCEPGYHPEK